MRPLTAFPERAQRLDRISKCVQPVYGNFPLLKVSRIAENYLDKLRATINCYLCATLEAFCKGQSFRKYDNLIDSCTREIQSLPNITPNGLILPKRQTFQAYNKIHSVVVDILDSLGLETHIEAVHAPINIRLVSGQPDTLVDSRPRASVKMHSDMWAGEPANAIMVFLPIFGEMEKIGIKWIEPNVFPVSFMRPLDDFDEGMCLIDGGIEYEASFMPGDILFADPFVLHATQKDAFGMRLSLEFRFIASEKTKTDKFAPGTRLRNYLPYEEWSQIGRNRT